MSILRQKGHIGGVAVATFVLAMIGGTAGAVAGAYATFITRTEYNSDIQEIKDMLRELYRHQLGHDPAPTTSPDKNLNRLGPNGACSSWAISTNRLNRLQDYLLGLCT